LTACNRSLVGTLAQYAVLWDVVDVHEGQGRMRPCRHDRSQGNWAIDGPVGVLRDHGAGITGLTTASLCPAQCSLIAEMSATCSWGCSWLIAGVGVPTAEWFSVIIRP